MTELVIRGGRVLVDGEFVDRDVCCRDGVIVDAVGPGADVFDASGLLVAPGFIDVQINGGWGHDFTTDPASVAAVAAELPATGVTAFLPTVVTTSPDRRAAALATPLPASALGWHFEGPMIAPSRVGAHDPAWVGPVGTDELATWAGRVRLVTLAPETPGAMAAIAALTAAGVTVAIGHTACTADEFAAARHTGAAAVTHLFNAMAPFSHRAPGPIGAALADPAVVAGLICDGIHVDPVAVAMAWRALGPDRTLLVTDAMAALGVRAVDEIVLGGLRVTVGDDGVRTPDGVLAGSNLSMDAAVRNLVAFTGCTPAEALGCASRVPADLLGLADRGRIAEGARADLVLLDESLHVRHTLLEGLPA